MPKAPKRKQTSKAAGKAPGPSQLDVKSLNAQPQGRPQGKRGRQFGVNTLPTAFHTIVDPASHPTQPWRDLPPPPGLPPFRMRLDDILDQATIAGIQRAQTMVFHAVGDTGGVNTPTYIENVASYMERDFDPSHPGSNPSFFYHLGDVVYYDGESANYYPEFYEPYIRYPAPIVAIPGNHDGDVDPATGETSLEAFVRNFCSQAPVFSPDNHDAPRQTMTQPNVYWTFLTPLATFVGLYSNCPEGGQLSQAQIDWLVSELKAAPAGIALIVAVHHPIYSAYGPKPGSQHLKDTLENACASAGRSPDLVLTGHVHNYQRFSAPLPGKSSVPFIVAGAGGYNKRLHVLNSAFHSQRLPIQIPGSDGVLENFNDSSHGYLKLTVTHGKIQGAYFAVPESGAAVPKSLQPFDTFVA